LLLLLLGTSFVFLIPAYVARVWNVGHYQFVPLVFVAVGAILWAIRGRVIEATEPCSAGAFALLLAVLSVQLVFANLLDNSFIGILAVITACWTAFYVSFGIGGVRVAWPVLALLLLAVPLPMQWDVRLMVNMQLMASDYASRFLNGIGVIHLRQGMILQTETASFSTEEASSGIRSIFSTWMVVAIYGVVMEHRWWRLFVNLLQVILWVMIGNVLKIVAVVGFADVAPWLASGIVHELLGGAVFGFGLMMVAFTDVAISELMRLWHVEDEWAIDIHTKYEVFRDLFANDQGKSPRIPVPSFPLQGGLRIFVFIILAIVAAVSLQSVWVRTVPQLKQIREWIDRAATPEAGVLPDTLAELQRVLLVRNTGPRVFSGLRGLTSGRMWTIISGPLFHRFASGIVGII
jgi:exosortase